MKGKGKTLLKILMVMVLLLEKMERNISSTYRRYILQVLKLS